MIRRLALPVLASAIICAATSQAADPKPAATKAAAGPGDTELVERLVSSRKEYQQTLIALYEHYNKTGDRERAKWASEELRAFHLVNKPSYRLDIQDVPPATLEAKANIKEANELYKRALEFKDRGFGNDFVLNQRRAEVLLQEVLQKYPSSDKIADVAYQLGDLYESRAYHQYDRAAAYFERAYQWRKGGQTDARLRAAKLYDRNLNERSKAIDLYRDEIANDTDQSRIKEAERRLAELTSTK